MRRLSRRQQLAAVLLTAVALLFISLDFAGGNLSGARGGAGGTLGALYRGTDSVLGPARRFVQGIPDVGRNRDQIAALEQRNDQLEQQVLRDALDAATARQLHDLQLQATATGRTLVPARVIATGPGSGFEWTVTIDAGSADRVQSGQTVVAAGALVGRVTSVHRDTSVVLLAADPTFGVGARDLRTGELLVATGRSSSGMTATTLGANSTVRVGDRLVTGPAGATTFVSGIEIGTVTGVPTSGSSSAITVRPAVGLTGLDLVGVVLAPVPTTDPRPTIGARS
jgi:rod shape-determining protein MreC